jgi:Sigma-70, region 4/Sigma-70 region 3
MLRHLQSFTWTSYPLRVCLRKATAAANSLATLTGRQPTAEEIAGELGISTAKYRQIQQHAHNAQLLSLEGLLGDPGNWCKNFIQQAPPLSLQDPAILVEKKERWEQVAAALAQLTKRDKRLVTLYYLKEQTPDEIAQIVGLPESEVHRLLTRALSRLQRLLAVLPAETTGAEEQRPAAEEQWCAEPAALFDDLTVLRKPGKGVASVADVRRWKPKPKQTALVGKTRDGQQRSRWQPTLRFIRQQRRRRKLAQGVVSVAAVVQRLNGKRPWWQ